MAKFEGDWVRIREVMANLKNRQLWNFGLQEVEFGIGSSRNEICRMELWGYSEFSREMGLKQRIYGQK